MSAFVPNLTILKDEKRNVIVSVTYTDNTMLNEFGIIKICAIQTKELNKMKAVNE